MGIKRPLSFSLVGNLIREEEIPSRNNDFPLETVLSVFRYGAMISSTVQRHDKLERAMDHARSTINDYENQAVLSPAAW